MRKEICVIDDDLIYQMIIKKMIHRTEVFNEVVIYSRADKALKRFQKPRYKTPRPYLVGY